MELRVCNLSEFTTTKEKHERNQAIKKIKYNQGSDKKCGNLKLNFGIDMSFDKLSYKKGDALSLPKGWEIKKLGEVCEMYQPKTISTKEMVEDGEYPVFGANGIIGKYDKYNHEEPQLLITCRGATCGSVNISEPKSWINGNAMVVRPKDHSIDLKFLEYLFRGGIDLSKTITGAAQPQITRQSLNPIEISYPKSLPEQQRIVSILDECFAAIDKAKANAERCLSLSKALFESYLQGVFDPSTRSGQGKKGDGWDEKTIKEVCELKSGTTISTNLERTEGDVLYVKVGDMTLPENEIEINTSSRFVNSSEVKANQIIPNGAIIFPKRGGAIATNKKRKIVKPTIVDLNTMAIIPNSKIDADYFFHWFQLIDLKTISNGTSIPQINNYSFDEVRIPFPKSKEDQQTIVRQLDALRAETQKLEAVYQKKLADLEELKKSMLQKAFAGELRTAKAVEV